MLHVNKVSNWWNGKQRQYKSCHLPGPRSRSQSFEVSRRKGSNGNVSQVRLRRTIKQFLSRLCGLVTSFPLTTCCFVHCLYLNWNYSHNEIFREIILQTIVQFDKEWLLASVVPQFKTLDAPNKLWFCLRALSQRRLYLNWQSDGDYLMFCEGCGK